MATLLEKEPFYIKLNSDWGFKRVFGSESNKHFLKYLLNTIIEDRNIVDVELRNTEHQYLSGGRGFVAFDVYCKCDNNESIIVEMQKTDKRNFLDRAFAYSALAVLDQAKTKWDFKLTPLYFVGITNYVLFKNKPGHFTKCGLCDLTSEGRNQIYDKYLQFFVELPKFAVTDPALASAKESLMYLIGHLGEFETKPEWLKGRNDILSELCEAAEFGRLSQKEKENYLMSEQDEIQWMNTLEDEKLEAREEGLAEGLAEGRAEGKTETARNFKALGVDVDIICKATGLSAEEVAAL